LHNQKNHNLFPSSDVIRMIKSKILRWAVYVALTTKAKMLTKFLLEILKGRDRLEDLGIILKLMLEK
jgi:hypothetical protein